MLNKFSEWPFYSHEEIKAVNNVLLSNKVNYWTGTEGKNFEAEFSKFVGTKYSVALANGTVALDTALHACNIGPGDEVIVTSRTFLASVSAIVNSKAIPIFADVDRNTQNITADTIQSKITVKTKAIICVHLAGWPCDMDPILEVSEKNNITIIEDCAQAHGAKYKGRSVGSIGHIGCWSFCQDKIISTGGEGGMITTNDYHLWSKIWSFKDHGKSWRAVNKRNQPTGFRWLHETFGTNFRMTEMQSAIGRIHLKRMKEWNFLRRKNAIRIWNSASKLPGIRVPKFQCDCKNKTSENCCIHAAYKCYVFIEKGKKIRDKLMEEINFHGIPCFSGTCSEVYLEKAFDKTKFRPKKRLPIAKELGETSLMFLCHPNLTSSEIKKTCDTLERVYNKLTK